VSLGTGKRRSDATGRKFDLRSKRVISVCGKSIFLGSRAKTSAKGGAASLSGPFDVSRRYRGVFIRAHEKVGTWGDRARKALTGHRQLVGSRG